MALAFLWIAVVGVRDCLRVEPLTTRVLANVVAY